MTPRQHFKSVKTGRTRTITFQVWGLDVWGNAKDGFEVNDRSRSGTLDLKVHEIEHNVGTPHAYKHWYADDVEFVRALKDQGFLKPRVQTRSIEVEQDEGVEGNVYIYAAKTREPLWQLEPPYENPYTNASHDRGARR